MATLDNQNNEIDERHLSVHEKLIEVKQYLARQAIINKNQQALIDLIKDGLDIDSQLQDENGQTLFDLALDPKNYDSEIFAIMKSENDIKDTSKQVAIDEMLKNKLTTTQQQLAKQAIIEKNYQALVDLIDRGLDVSNQIEDENGQTLFDLALEPKNYNHKIFLMIASKMDINMSFGLKHIMDSNMSDNAKAIAVKIAYEKDKTEKEVERLREKSQQILKNNPEYKMPLYTIEEIDDEKNNNLGNSPQEVSRLYIDLLKEEQRVEPEIIEKRKQIASDMGYELTKTNEFIFNRNLPTHLVHYKLASSHIFSDYNKTIQETESSGIIFEWVLKKIFDLSEEIKKEGGNFKPSLYKDNQQYKNLFKADSLPRFESKAAMVLYATNYYYNNLDQLKHLFLEENREEIKKTIIEDIKLINNDNTQRANTIVENLFNYILHGYINEDERKKIKYINSNIEEKQFYNQYTEALFLDIFKENHKLFPKSIYIDFFSSVIGSDKRLDDNRKKDIDQIMNLLKNEFSNGQIKNFYATLLKHAKEEALFNINKKPLNDDFLGESLGYILRKHFPQNFLSMKDVSKNPIFLDFIKVGEIHSSWKSIILDMIDFKSFDTIEKSNLIDDLLNNTVINQYAFSEKEKNSIYDLSYSDSINNKKTLDLLWNKFKNDITESELNSLLKNTLKNKNIKEINASFNIIDMILSDEPKCLHKEQINSIAEFLFVVGQQELKPFRFSELIDMVFSHPLYRNSENREKVAEHYYLNLDKLLNSSQIVNNKLSQEERVKVIHSIIDTPLEHPNFQYNLAIFESLIKHNSKVINEKYYKKYNALTYLVDTLKTDAICVPFLDSFLKLNTEQDFINQVDKHNQKPINYVKRRKNIAEERIYDLLLNHGATVELSAFNKLMISFSSLFKSKTESDFEYVASEDTNIKNKYELLLEEVSSLSKKSENILSQYHAQLSDSEFDMISTRLQSIYQNAIKVVDIAKKDEALIEPEKLFYLENTLTKYLPDSFSAFVSGMKSTEILDEFEKEEKVKYLIKEFSQQTSILAMKTTNISKDYIHEIVEGKILDSAKHTQFLKSKI